MDFGFKTGLANTALNQRNIRLEARGDQTKCGVPGFLIGGNLHIGDNYTYNPKPFVVGTQATPNTKPSNT